MAKDTTSLIGRKFGHWTVIGFDRVDTHGNSYWWCECDCQNKTRKSIARNNLRINGGSQSCGCYQKQRTREATSTHGMHGDRLYSIWHNMRNRCEYENSINYDNYGARGVAVCDEWHQFENFRDWAFESGYTEELTLDRIKNDREYSPDNCRWLSFIDQQNNKRTNRRIKYNDEELTLAQWARKLGVNYDRLRHKLNRNDYSEFEEYFDK